MEERGVSNYEEPWTLLRVAVRRNDYQAAIRVLAHLMPNQVVVPVKLEDVLPLVCVDVERFGIVHEYMCLRCGRKWTRRREREMWCVMCDL